MIFLFVCFFPDQIATISPGMASCENTLNTLRYANRYKCSLFGFLYIKCLLDFDYWWNTTKWTIYNAKNNNLFISDVFCVQGKRLCPDSSFYSSLSLSLTFYLSFLLIPCCSRVKEFGISLSHLRVWAQAYLSSFPMCLRSRYTLLNLCLHLVGWFSPHDAWEAAYTFTPSHMPK